MGAVYQASDHALGREVAVKFIRAGLPGALHEARMTARPKHPNIVDLYDYGEGPPPYLVMEWLEGRDLAKLLVAEGAVPWRRAVGLIIQASQAVEAAHQSKIVHYDLKPGNLFVEGKAPNEFVKVLDFGIAELQGLRLAGASGADSKRMGTAGYMAPEIRCRGGVVGETADVYALGAILHELLSGDRPDGSGVAEPLVSVPTLLADTVRRALAMSPAERHQSAAELRQSLDACLLIREATDSGGRVLPPHVGTT